MVVSTLDVLRLFIEVPVPIQEMRGHVFLCFKVTHSTPVYTIFLLSDGVLFFFLVL
jgi:hypothetical protein